MLAANDAVWILPTCLRSAANALSLLIAADRTFALNVPAGFRGKVCSCPAPGFEAYHLWLMGFVSPLIQRAARLSTSEYLTFFLQTGANSIAMQFR
jgi:hypothetical protein